MNTPTIPNTQTIATTPGRPDYSMRTRLDGRNYQLRFLWNMREERWYFDIISDADELLAAGIKIIANRPLIRFYQWDVRLPPGEFRAVDLSTNGSPPGLFDMGKGLRVELTYYPVNP